MDDVKFPITVSCQEDNETQVFDNQIEAAMTLEWFDSDDPEEKASVTDSRGRSIRVKIENLEVMLIELRDGI